MNTNVGDLFNVVCESVPLLQKPVFGTLLFKHNNHEFDILANGRIWFIEIPKHGPAWVYISEFRSVPAHIKLVQSSVT